jgi:hypothetical protein
MRHSPCCSEARRTRGARVPRNARSITTHSPVRKEIMRRGRFGQESHDKSVGPPELAARIEARSVQRRLRRARTSIDRYAARSDFDTGRFVGIGIRRSRRFTAGAARFRRRRRRGRGCRRCRRRRGCGGAGRLSGRRSHGIGRWSLVRARGKPKRSKNRREAREGCFPCRTEFGEAKRYRRRGWRADNRADKNDGGR